MLCDPDMYVGWPAVNITSFPGCCCHRNRRRVPEDDLGLPHQPTQGIRVLQLEHSPWQSCLSMQSIYVDVQLLCVRESVSLLLIGDFTFESENCMVHVGIVYSSLPHHCSK